MKKSNTSLFRKSIIANKKNACGKREISSEAKIPLEIVTVISNDKKMLDEIFNNFSVGIIPSLTL